MKTMIIHRFMMLLGCALLIAGSYYYIQASNRLDDMEFEIKFQEQIMGEGLFRGTYEPERAIALIEKAKSMRAQRNYSQWGIFAGGIIVLIGFIYAFLRYKPMSPYATDS